MQQNVCEKCSAPIQEDFEFCPHCGYAITLGAKELTKQKYDIVRLKLLSDLGEDITDAKTLKKIRDYAKKFSA